MYYKIISGGQIVDACEGLRYVHWQEKNRLFLTCGEQDADGIVSTDGENVYLLEGSQQIGDYAYASVTEIMKEEYDELRDELDSGAEIPDDSGNDQPDSPAKTRLQLLEEQVAALEETNYLLTECLLEMSEIVYGEG